MAVLPVWITVDVPKDAGAGDYEGNLTVSAEGIDKVEVPLTLRIADFTIPGAKDFVTYIGFIQSPESVAEKYKVPMWSGEHWRLLDKTFRLLGRIGNKCVFIPLVCRTHFGNEHTMVRWIKKENGSYDYDFSIVEKYLDLVAKHLGKIPIVCFYVWEPVSGSKVGTGNEPPPAWYTKEARRNRNSLPAHVTFVDPTTGKIENVEFPGIFWESEKSTGFWKPVFDGLRERLAARGLEKAMAIGMAGDAYPLKAAYENIAKVAPEAGWVFQSHYYRAVGQYGFRGGMRIVVNACIWKGVKYDAMPDPETERVYGWRERPTMITTFPRDSFRTYSPRAWLRAFIEGYHRLDFNGLSRVGADFWNVRPLQGKRGKGRFQTVIHHAHWGNLSLDYDMDTYLFEAGRKEPIATIRSEMIRAGLQEAETRIWIEKVLLDPEKRARLGGDLAKRCEKLLDERTVRLIFTFRSVRRVSCSYEPYRWLWFAQDLQERAWNLYSAAGEMARALGM